MNLQIVKTEAEKALGEQFEKVAGDLPGTGALSEARDTAMGVFATLGLPHRRVEEWKYTDLRTALKSAFPPAIDNAETASSVDIDSALGPLADLDAPRVVFVNGSYRASLSTLDKVAGLEVTSLADTIGNLPRLSVSETDAAIALNTAFMSDGAVVTVADNADLKQPVLIVFARSGSAPKAVNTRNIITIGKAARVTLIEAHVELYDAGEGQSNTLTEIVIGDGAHVAHIKSTQDGTGSTHLSTVIGELGANTTYNVFQQTANTKLTRNSLFVTFNGEDAKLDISGVFLGRDSEHIDTTLVVDHAVPGCVSRELFKGVLDNRARGIFQGKVIVRQDAQKSDGKQMAQVLMLSDDAEFDSKPELEIYADDVVCGHGSTSAQLDEDMMFYFRSRGIPADAARAMMIESFIGEALDVVEHEDARRSLRRSARNWLGAEQAS